MTKQQTTIPKLSSLAFERYSFDGPKSGEHLVVTARIHGDEPSGEISARRILRKIATGKLHLDSGRVTILPVLNPFGKAENRRGQWQDNNRDIRFHTPKEILNPEIQIRANLAEFFHETQRQAIKIGRAWHHLDLHSVPLEGEPHSITADKPEDLNFARAIGVPKIYNGWRVAQQNISDEDFKALERTKEEHDQYTLAAIYASSASGAASSVCVESGQNDDPQSTQVATCAIRRALSHLGITKPYKDHHKPAQTFREVSFHQALFRRDDTERLIGINSDAQPVEPGQVILQGGTREVTVPALPSDAKRWIVSHPIPTARVGEHIGFLALER